MAAYVYDFGVRGASAVRALQMSRPDSAIAFSKPALHQTATSSNETVDGGGVREQEKTPDSTVSDQEKPAAARPNSEYVHGAVLGVTVADWEQGGFKGVEVLEVANESSGYMAGLRKGNVITHVNGAHINSAEDLDGILSRLEPGSKISIGYMFKSNLGWMPVQAVAILGRGN